MTDTTVDPDFHDELQRSALAEVDNFGIASADMFDGAPAGHRPTDLMPECKSVVVFALKHLDVFTVTRDLACQAYSQDIMNRETLHQAYRISRCIERRGFLAFPTVDSVSMWPFAEDKEHVAGCISLRHAAQLAGLGRIGRNAMLLTPEFGPRVQLGAILTDARLAASAPLRQNPCNACDLCIKHCPAGALSAPVPPAEYAPVDRGKCVAFRRAYGGKSPLGYPNACGICRAVCPIGKRMEGQYFISGGEQDPGEQGMPILARPKEETVPDRTVTYKRINGVELKLHVFAPQDHGSAAKRPAIVFFFGGAWRGGSPSQFYPQCTYLASRGMIAISAEYRVESQHGTSPYECVADGKSAVRWTRQHAGELGIDPERIAAGGGSAGGHVAVATATVRVLDEPTEDHNISSRPNALVLFNPVFDNGPNGWGHERVKERWREFSPLHNIAPVMPPTIVFLGSQDRVLPVSAAEEFKKRMAAVGARCDVWIYEGQPHGFFNYRDGGNPYYNATVFEADRFLASIGYIQGEPTLQKEEVEATLSQGQRTGLRP